MPDTAVGNVAIVDIGLGNLFSVKNACEHVGLRATVTSSRDEVLTADAVILPGVGAFGDAMRALHRLDLAGPLKEIAESDTPLIGICLGMQLLMTESFEFGKHRGMGVFEGPVVRFNAALSCDSPAALPEDKRLKVPQIGWNHIYHNTDRSGPLLTGLESGEFMYFVHSYYAIPRDSSVVLTTTRYGEIEFCSSIARRNVFAFQFHPERSGPKGLQIYRNLCGLIQERKKSQAV